MDYEEGGNKMIEVREKLECTTLSAKQVLLLLERHKNIHHTILGFESFRSSNFAVLSIRTTEWSVFILLARKTSERLAVVSMNEPVEQDTALAMLMPWDDTVQETSLDGVRCVVNSWIMGAAGQGISDDNTMLQFWENIVEVLQCE